MARVDDVAAAIIRAPIYVDQLKLQKLLYFAQAWYLAWYDEPLFDDRIEGWPRGPAVPRIYGLYGTELRYGWQQIREPAAGNPDALDDRRRAALDAILEEYGSLPGDELEKLAKQDPPWNNARIGLAKDQPGNNVIPRHEMRDFYRRYGSFGPASIDVDISAETLKGVRRGDKDAFLRGLREASGQP